MWGKEEHFIKIISSNDLDGIVSGVLTKVYLEYGVLNSCRNRDTEVISASFLGDEKNTQDYMWEAEGWYYDRVNLYKEITGDRYIILNRPLQLDLPTWLDREAVIWIDHDPVNMNEYVNDSLLPRIVQIYTHKDGSISGGDAGGVFDEGKMVFVRNKDEVNFQSTSMQVLQFFRNCFREWLVTTEFIEKMASCIAYLASLYNLRLRRFHKVLTEGGVSPHNEFSLKYIGDSNFKISIYDRNTEATALALNELITSVSPNTGADIIQEMLVHEGAYDNYIHTGELLLQSEEERLGYLFGEITTILLNQKPEYVRDGSGLEKPLYFLDESDISHKDLSAISALLKGRLIRKYYYEVEPIVLIKK